MAGYGLLGLAALAVLPTTAASGASSNPASVPSGTSLDANAEGWVETEGGRVRLVVAPPDADGRARGAIEIDLDEGWKTYWIAPGPSGVPPRFEAARSENVALEALRLPAPETFEDAYGTSVGYADDTAFAVDLRLDDPNGPATLRLDGFLGICAEICIPVPLSLEARIGEASDPATADAVERAWLALPVEGNGQGLELSRVGAELVLRGEGLDGAEVHLAPPGTLSLDAPSMGPSEARFPVLRGEGAGEAVVLIVEGEAPFVRAVEHRVELGDPD